MVAPMSVFLSRSTAISILPRGQQVCLLPRSYALCLCPSSVLIKRHKAKWNSRFPKEDGVTRLEQLAQKMNQPTEKQKNQSLPSDMGVHIDSTNQIFSSYVPVEKKRFLLSGQGLKERWEGFKSMLISTYGIAMIKRKIKPFKVVDFSKVAQQKFIDVNNALQRENNKSVQILLKDNATLMVVKGLQSQFMNPAKKVHWRFVKEVDRPRVVHARVASIFDKDNLFAQLTVRIHTEQILAIRDRYNRIVTGDIKKPKSVIDYVVFERHLTDPYGKWRICGKLFQPGIGVQKQIKSV